MLYILSLVVAFLTYGWLVSLFNGNIKDFVALLVIDTALILYMLSAFGNAVYPVLYTVLCICLSCNFFSWGYSEVFNKIQKIFCISIGPFPNRWVKYSLTAAFYFLFGTILIAILLTSIFGDVLSLGIFRAILRLAALMFMATVSGFLLENAHAYSKASIR